MTRRFHRLALLFALDAACDDPAAPGESTVEPADGETTERYER